MAGTLGFKVSVRHTYQRRFNRKDLKAVLAGCHWYLISASPTIRIVPGTASTDDGILTVSFASAHPYYADKTLTFGAVFADGPIDAEFQVLGDGNYFSFRFGDISIHGDSWALAAFLSGNRVGAAKQEVLYIGKAFGGGRRTAWHRTSGHATLQRIYEDLHDEDLDVFVSPLAFAKRWTAGDDHIDDLEPGPDSRQYEALFKAVPGKVAATEVDLIEHGLISHFKPRFNQKLTAWNPSDPTDPMTKMRTAGFRLLNISLDGTDGLARFCSATQPEASRSHFVAHDLPVNRQPDTRGGISATNVSLWRPQAQLLREGPAMLADLAEQRDLVFKTFGDQAPAIRRPPSLFLDHAQHPDTSGNDRTPRLDATAIAVRTSVRAERERQAAEHDTYEYDGEPTFDAATGTIVIAKNPVSGEPKRWPLRNLDGTGRSAFIYGDDGLGKSTMLFTMFHQAALAGQFVTWLCDPRNGFGLRASHGETGGHHVATTPEATVEAIHGIADVVDYLRSADGPGRIDPVNAGVLLFIDDFDDVIADRSIDPAIATILNHGGSVGVGLVLVLRNAHTLQTAVARWPALAATDPLAFTEEWKAMSIGEWLSIESNEPLPRTPLSEDPTLMLFHDGRNMYAGLLMAWEPQELSFEAARDRFDQLIRSDVESEVSWWGNDAEHGLCIGLDMSTARRWAVHALPDAWALSMILASSPMDPDRARYEHVRWANSVFRDWMELPRYQWRKGPAAPPNEFMLYARISGEIRFKEQRDNISAIMRFLIE